MKSEFIFEDGPHALCHAATIEETPSGLVAAWFGGTKEGHKDVKIWSSCETDAGWTRPQIAADGERSNGHWPCWNPVMVMEGGTLRLYYKVGNKPWDGWWGEFKDSVNDGAEWGLPQKLPDGFLGPVKNRPIFTSDGSLLCGSSTEAGGRRGWRVHFEIRLPDGQWIKRGVPESPAVYDAIQPTFLRHGDRSIQALCRNSRGPILETWSYNDGIDWSPLQPTSLPNPNSGIAALTLKDGRHLLCYHPIARRRRFAGEKLTPLVIAMSDDGVTWNTVCSLESDASDYSYPTVMQSADGKVHIVYTWQWTRIKHVEIDPTEF